MHCHFHNPVSIHSGPGMRRQIGALAAKYGKKALIVTRDSEQVIKANDMQIEVTPIWKWLLKD